MWRLGARRIGGMGRAWLNNNDGFAKRMKLGAVLDAAKEIQGFLEKAGGRFCFIGGVAVQRWGEPRFTRDADMTLLTEFTHDEKWLDLLLTNFSPRRPDARDFALARRVLLVSASNGVDLDIALGGLPFEARCIERASPWELPEGSGLLTCSAEDLVVHKAFASRDVDWLDVERILMRQGAKLNVVQILEELTPLAELKEDATIVPRLQALINKRAVS